MDIAFIINREDGRTTINAESSACVATDKPCHFHSPPTTPKDHCYYRADMSREAVEPSLGSTPAHFRFYAGHCQKPENSLAVFESKNDDDDDEDEKPSAILQQASHMPLKKRPLRKRGMDDRAEASYVAVRLLGNQKRRERSEATSTTTMATLPLSKKARTDAAMIYGSMNIDIPEVEVFPPEWFPSLAVFDDRPAPIIRWKGTPLDVSHLPYYAQLHPSEACIASTLRLMPEQYIRCKRVLILAAQAAQKKNISFRKSEAQKLCRIDVNKVSVLWDVFGKLGWLGTCWPGEDHRHRR